MTATRTPRSRRGLRLAGGLILAGLLVEALTLLSNHHLAFVLFLFIGGLLVVTGIVVFVSLRVRGDRRRGARS